MRLIDADELLKAVDKEREYLLARGQTGAEHILVHNFRDLIDNAPKVELFCSYLSDGEVKQPCVEAPCKHEQPNGHWIENDYQPYDYDTVFKCSICGKEIYVPDHIASKVFEHDKYCFNCGAKMKGAEE